MGATTRVGRSRQAVGRDGEELVARLVVAAGWRVLARNWRCRYGELDLVALDGDCLVFCEVKTRRSVRAGHPLEAVTPDKVRRLRRLTGVWLQQYDGPFDAVRIDVFAVLHRGAGGGRLPLVEHLRAVG
ncbi:YraN family protein [Spongisporangium articulatum]|uniref:UPF0102 protein ACIB24_11835 n=1 Tax=Spongisporangium articulatum TaxID=3362603 RepID=A0ABW8AMZ3_9ACTN